MTESNKDTPDRHFSTQEIELPPRKQNLTEEELNQQNIRGYAALAQELFKIKIVYGAPKEILRKNSELDPLKTIGIDQSKSGDLIKGVELALSRLTHRGQQAMILAFALDMPIGSEFISRTELGGKMNEYKTDGVTAQRVRGFIAVQMGKLRHHSTSKELRLLLGK